MIFMKCLSTLAPEAQSLISVPLCAGLFLVSRLFIENNHSFFCHFPLLKPYKIQGVIITCKFQCFCVFYRTLLIITDRIHLCSRWILFRCRYLMIAGFHCGSPCSRAVARSTMISSVASCTSQREGLMMCYMFPTNVFFLNWWPEFLSGMISLLMNKA